MLAAIEAGGTKFVCAVGDHHGSLAQTMIATRDVESTRANVLAFLDTAIEEHGPIDGIGIGSFGPLQLDRHVRGYGCITTTPKPGWKGVDLPAWFASRYRVPVAIDTDVNAAALAEARLLAVARLAYITVGTGIGVGVVVAGQPQSGFGHPEAGHIPVRRDPAHGAFPGTCDFHGDCLEGLASGPAIAAAWGNTLAHLPCDHPAWEIEARYLGQLCATLILTIAPDRLVLGGGVMQQTRLLPMVREATLKTLRGYCGHWNEAACEARIVPPRCREPSGLVGAYILADNAIRLMS